MICLTCKKMVADPFCMDCGQRPVDHKCQCGNNLSYWQKFCEKCGSQVPPKPYVSKPKCSAVLGSYPDSQTCGKIAQEGFDMCEEHLKEMEHA